MVTIPNKPLTTSSMQYHQIIIFFHRPWVSKNYIQPRSPRQGPGYHHARRMCVESATAVARLLHIYEKHYTFRRMNNQVVAIIFSAALMLLFVTVSSSPLMPAKPGEASQPHPRNAEMVAYLNLCFRALDELGQSFENAKRTRDYLVTLQRRWQAHMRRSGPGAKRQISSANLPSLSSQPPSTPQDPRQDPSADVSHKKTRLSDPSPQAHHAHNPTSTNPPSTANTQFNFAQHLASHQIPPRYQQQPFTTPSGHQGEIDWIRDSDLSLLSGNNGNNGDPNIMGGLPTPNFPDGQEMLTDLGDMDGWWGSPNAHSGLGG